MTGPQPVPPPAPFQAPARCQAPVGERGAGTVLMLAVCFAAVLMAGAVSLLGQALVSRHRAQAAADLAALAAADPVRGGCASAARVAAGNGAGLRSCRVTAGVADVVVSAGPAPAGPFVGRATSRARAGPLLQQQPEHEAAAGT
jgi:secretion/DNA translocation related TadE-like protein